jgi:hypothetical protein
VLVGQEHVVPLLVAELELLVALVLVLPLVVEAEVETELDAPPPCPELIADVDALPEDAIEVAPPVAFPPVSWAPW